MTESSLAGLLGSEALAWSIVDAVSGAGAVLVDRDLNISAASAGEALSARGYGRELRGRHLSDVIPAAALERYRPHYERALLGQKSTIEAETDDGASVFATEFSPVRDESGEVVGAMAISRDVTEARRAQRSLASSEREFRLLAEHATDMISRFDAEGVCRYASPASERLFGYRPDEVIGRSTYDFFHSDDVPSLEDVHQQVLAGPDVETVRYRLRHKDGSDVLVESTVRQVRDPDSGQVTEIHAVTRDVGDRTEADELRRQWELTFECSTRGIAVTDPNTGIMTAVNPAFAKMHGGVAEDFVGRSVGMLLAPEFRERLAELMAMAESEGHAQTETAHVRLDGSMFSVAAEAFTTHDAEGRMVYRIAWFEDLTERRAADAASRDAVEVFEKAFTGAPIGLALVDLDGRFVRSNRSLQQLTGYSEQELSQLTFQEITHPDDLAADLEFVEQLLAGEIDNYSMEKRYFTAQGRQVWITLAASLVRDAAGEPMHFIAQIEDITERKRLEASLHRLADHDPLTDLWNRRRFEDELHRQIGRCQRYGERAALLMIDLDDFKPVNDKYGHKAGDDLLKAIAAGLARRVRATDSLARLGGDEFVAILTNVSPDQAATLAGELRSEIATSRVVIDGEPVSVTASVGIAFLDDRTASDEEATLRADRAMYDAKAAARSQTKDDAARAAVPSAHHAARQESHRTISVLHCDDSEAYRLLIAEMVGNRDDIEFVGEASDGAGAERLASELQPEVILLDARMHGSDAQLVNRLRMRVPGVKVIVLSGVEPDPGSVAEHADAFVHKSAPFDAVAEAISG